MNTKGLALVTVMGFILILSLLMVPLALGITQLTSSTNVVASKIGMAEARNSAVELVRYYIAKSATACQEDIAFPSEDLAQGSLKPAISCKYSITAWQNGDVYRYWDFYVTYTPTPTNAAEESICFTGSAVEYISPPTVEFIPTPTVVYITHVEDKHVEDEPHCPR